VKEKIKKWIKRYDEIMTETAEERDFRVVMEFEKKREKVSQRWEGFKYSLMLLIFSFIFRFFGGFKIFTSVAPSSSLLHEEIYSPLFFFCFWGYLSLFVAGLLEWERRITYSGAKKRRNRRLGYDD